MRLVVLADDLTGALDTGIQFAKLGIRTELYPAVSSLRDALAGSGTEVFVINTSTRHLTEREAYQRLYEAAAAAKAYGADAILKKTDSGLRGNIGSEISAVMDGAEGLVLHFLPSYPAMNRITQNGVHYIDGICVSESVFGRDPFEPVKESRVSCLISGTGKRIWDSHDIWRGEPGIVIWDASAEAEMQELTNRLERRQPAEEIHLWAGCAGLAAALAGGLPFKRRPQQRQEKTGRLLVICGSVNEVTARQAAAAARGGFFRKTIPPEALLSDAGPSPSVLRELLQKYREGFSCIADTGFADREEIERECRRADCSPKEMGRRVSASLGELAVNIMEREPGAAMMVIGGDTLQAVTDRMGFDRLELLGELVPGVVRIRARKDKREWILLTKSGGFGGEDLLLRLESEETENEK